MPLLGKAEKVFAKLVANQKANWEATKGLKANFKELMSMAGANRRGGFPPQYPDSKVKPVYNKVLKGLKIPAMATVAGTAGAAGTAYGVATAIKNKDNM